jgi:hypothetical protein
MSLLETQPMRTIHSVYKEKLPNPKERQRFDKAEAAYEDELLATARSLGRLTGLDPALLERVAFEIVGQEVVETETRENLAAKYGNTQLELGRASMQALDGGYHAMWAAARTD